MNKVGSIFKFTNIKSGDKYFKEWTKDILRNPSKTLIMDYLRKATRFMNLGNDITHIEIKDRWLVREGRYTDERRPCGVYIDKVGQTWGINGCGGIDYADLITE